MFRLIKDVVRLAERHELLHIAATAKFVDGRISNPHSKVKNNLQLHDAGSAERSAALLQACLLGNEEFRDFAFPKTVAPPMLVRYEPGMAYGLHPDVALMRLPSGPLRSDLSCTIFLNDPESYEGGALRIVLGTEEMRIRGPAGSAIVYPSTTLHEVEAVTSGSRIVGLTFIQSLIAENAAREMLFDLNEVAALESHKMSSENVNRIQTLQNNLLRRWADAP